MSTEKYEPVSKIQGIQTLCNFKWLSGSMCINSKQL